MPSDKTEFFTGQLVRLKSGGPTMTVEAGTDDEGEQIPVVWFDGKELKRAEICGLCLDQF